nr:FtsX-like permease family protein [Bacteroides intestinalis]
MIKIIRHQLWNQRRQNGWIFVELIIVSFFLWTVIDPIYVLTSNLALDPGYDEERAYALYMDYYDELHGKFDKAQDSVAIRQENLYRITRLVKNCPEVESFALVTNASFPNCNSWNGGQYFNDTLKVHSQYYQFVQAEGGDVFRTFGMKDAKNGQIMSLPEDCAAREGVFVSERMAKELFGTADAVGKRVRYGDSTFHEVMGVLQDYKHRINEQPGNLLIQVNGKIPNHNWIQRMYMVTFRLKQNVDVAVFEKRFKAEVVPQLNVGNFYFTKLGRFADIRRQYENESGVTNTLRLQYSLAGFALLCVFLGMVGTFWIRCNARRQDIGLMRSMGATRKGICNQFLTEAWLLVTVAFVVSLPLTIHRVYASGFANPTMDGNPDYWQNQPYTHFFIVSLLTYVVLLIIALLGTYAPVTRAAKILPAEALRDE